MVLALVEPLNSFACHCRARRSVPVSFFPQFIPLPLHHHFCNCSYPTGIAARTALLCQYQPGSDSLVGLGFRQGVSSILLHRFHSEPWWLYLCPCCASASFVAHTNRSLRPTLIPQSSCINIPLFAFRRCELKNPLPSLSEPPSRSATTSDLSRDNYLLHFLANHTQNIVPTSALRVTARSPLQDGYSGGFQVAVHQVSQDHLARHRGSADYYARWHRHSC